LKKVSDFPVFSCKKFRFFRFIFWVFKLAALVIRNVIKLYLFHLFVSTQTNSWTPQEWWIIYSKGIQLVKLLLEQHSHLFIKDALFFIGIQEEYLTECILLAKSSLEPSAVKLIKVTLELMAEVIGFESIWRIDYFQSIMSLMVRFIC
jgi:hypothetical protein